MVLLRGCFEIQNADVSSEGRWDNALLWVSLAWKVTLNWQALSPATYTLGINAISLHYKCCQLCTPHRIQLFCAVQLNGNCLSTHSFLFAVHIHPDPSGGADSRCRPQQACLDVGGWNGSQWPGSLHWEWGCLDPRARRPWRGSAGHGPCPVSTKNLLIWKKNNYVDNQQLLAIKKT